MCIIDYNDNIYVNRSELLFRIIYYIYGKNEIKIKTKKNTQKVKI